MPLSADFLANPQLFCTNHVVEMPGTTMQGAKLPAVGTFFNNRAPGGAPVKMGHMVAAAPTQVCWWEHDPPRVRLIVQNSAEHVNLTAQGVHLADWFSAYFLPWGSGQIGRMQIPAQPAVAVPHPVRAFFTAEMNGCSFFVAGGPASPLVAHYNVANPPGANLTQQQKDQVQNSMVKALMRGKRGGANLGNENAAVLRWKPPSAHGDPTTGAHLASNPVNVYEALPMEVTHVENDVRQGLAGNNEKVILGGGMPGSGILTDLRVATMGTLDAASRHWTFFYQRSMFTQVNSKQRLGRMGGIIKLLGRDHRQLHQNVRYMRIGGWEYTELWPNGAGVVTIPAHGDPDV